MNYKLGTKVFGDWEITTLLGEGSYGKVFEIQKTSFGITTSSALKVISIPQSQSDIKTAYSDGMDEQTVTSYFKGFVDEIVKEILVMTTVKSHPNIVSYEDHKVIEHEGSIGWDILIRMELLTPLVDYQLNHVFSEADVKRLGLEISGALEYCHVKNIIHRDIKPENIFVSETGQFKIGDFGVARTVDKTTGGMSKKGTENYMAPEVYLGKPYGMSVDVYSLGLVLYRLANGNRLPFLPLAPNPITFSDRENAIIRRMRGDALPKPEKVSDLFAKVILKACAFESANRYKTAAEMKKDLELLEDEYGSHQDVFEQERTVSMWERAKQSEYVKKDKTANLDVETTLYITCVEASIGCKKQITETIMVDGRPCRKSFQVNIPKNIKDGQIIRLRGAGNVDKTKGDMLVKIKLIVNSQGSTKMDSEGTKESAQSKGTKFQSQNIEPGKGDLLISAVKLTALEAIHGCKKNIYLRVIEQGKVVDKTYQVSIPPGIKDGCTIRLTNCGNEGHGPNSKKGDIHVQVAVDAKSETITKIKEVIKIWRTSLLRIQTSNLPCMYFEGNVPQKEYDVVQRLVNERTGNAFVTPKQQAIAMLCDKPFGLSKKNNSALIATIDEIFLLSKGDNGTVRVRYKDILYARLEKNEQIVFLLTSGKSIVFKPKYGNIFNLPELANVIMRIIDVI